MGSTYLTNRGGLPLYTYLEVADELITRQDGHLEVRENEITEIIKVYSMSSRWHPNQVYSHHPNLLGLFNQCGNVAEMVYERGIAYGGSFLDPGYDIRIDSEKPYDAPSPLIGFRVIAARKS